jgi:tRNA pseudouridine55 synthase
MFGIINLNKPSGPTSRDCVNHIQRIVRPLKVGHAGTLDPMADGVLLIAIGSAVRLMDWLHKNPKTYEATFELGKSSLSGDNQIEVQALADAPSLTRDDILSVLPTFQGLIQQTPPIYSAVHVDGKRAYELARSGHEVKLEPRDIVIHRIELTNFDYPTLKLVIECGTGTYIRSLGQDIARRLGSDAIMTQLRRTAIGEFNFADAVTLEDLDSVEAIAGRLDNPVMGLSFMPKWSLNDQQLIDVGHGKSLQLPSDDLLIQPRVKVGSDQTSSQQCLGLDVRGNLRSILEHISADQWKPLRNF